MEEGRIGRYRLVRRLGAGAMGEVFLARDPHIDRLLAIKKVRLGSAPAKGATGDRENRLRLLREAKAAGRLLHPNVVTLFDAGEQDGEIYLAFEYVEGSDLQRRMANPPPLTLGEVLRIVREVAQGLTYAHGLGVIHRDIKPGNILLGPGGTAKLADFGIARLVGQATELTTTGAVIGSPQYLAPEQVRGEELDGRNDLFSLGVVFYQLLTGRRPFAGDTVTTLVYQILHHQPPPARHLRPSLPLEVDALLRRLLAKDRQERVGSAGELAAALEDLERRLPPGDLASEMGSVEAATAATRTPSRSRAEHPSRSAPLEGRRLVLALATAVVFFGLGAAVWMGARARQAERPPAELPSAAETRTAPPGPPDGEPSSGEPELSGLPEESGGDGVAVAAAPAVEAPALRQGPPPSSAEPRGEGPAAGSAPGQPSRSDPPGAGSSDAAPPAASPGERPPGTAGGGLGQRPGPRSQPGSPDLEVIDSGLELSLRVEPADALVTVDGRRTAPIRRWTSGSPAFRLQGPGEYHLVFRRHGYRPATVLIRAAADREGVTPVEVRLEALPEGIASSGGVMESYEVREAVALRVLPPRARVIVDGELLGPAGRFSGENGGWLSLSPGSHRLLVTAVGHHPEEVEVLVTETAEEERRVLNIRLRRKLRP